MITYIFEAVLELHENISDEKVVLVHLPFYKIKALNIISL